MFYKRLIMNLSIRNYPSFRNRHHHRHHQFHACSGCPRHSDTHCHIGKDRCRISYFSSARTSGRRTVCFAMVADHLNDGLRSWKGICHRWFQLAIGVFVVPIFQGIQLSSCRAILACPHTLAWIWTLRTCCLKAPRVGGSLSLSALCLQKRYHRSSEMVLMLMPSREYAVHTKLARLANIVWVTSPSVESICRELITSLSAFMYTCNQVALLMRENRPVLSAPVNAWNAGKAFALSDPTALHIGSIRITPEAIEIYVFLSIRS